MTYALSVVQNTTKLLFRNRNRNRNRFPSKRFNNNIIVS